MFVYPICIQTYDKVSILRISSKLRLHRVVFLGVGLQMPKISFNIMKVGIHSYLPNADLNLWLNFNSKKLVKSENLLCGFAKVGVQGGENSSKCRERWSECFSIKWASKLWSNFNSKKLVRSKTSSCIFAKVGLKRVQITRNIAKVGVHILYQTCIQTYDQVSILRIWSKPRQHRAVLLGFGLKMPKSSSQPYESWHALLSSKCAFKSMIQF